MTRLDPKLAAVMTPFPYSAAPTDPVEKALALMREHGFKHLPVVEHFHCVGLVSFDAARSVPQGKDLRVQDLQPTKPLLVDVATPLDEVLQRMIEDDTACAVVLKADKIAGIFTGVDACRVLLGLLPQSPPDEAA